MHLHELKHMKRILTILILCYFPLIMVAQKPDLLFEQINDKSGRTIGFISGIEQDNNGFMWFSTRNGLIRYDGYDYKIFKHLENDSSSLPFNNITQITKAPDGNFWLSHSGRFAIFGGEANIFTHDSILSKRYDSSVRIRFDGNNNIWLAPSENNNVVNFRKEGSQEHYFQLVPEYLHKTYAYFNNNKNVTAQITQVGNNTKQSKDFTIKESGHYLVVSVGEAMQESLFDYGSLSQNGRLVWKMDGTKIRKVCDYNGLGIHAELIELKYGNYTLNYISDDTNAWEDWTTKAPELVDFYGIKLIKIENSELKKIKNKLVNRIPKNSLKSATIDYMTVNNNGNICLLTTLGLDIFNPKDSSFTHHPIDYTGSFSLAPEITVRPNTVYQDSRNNYWIGTSSGIIKYNSSLKIGITYQNNDKTPYLLSSNIIWCFLEIPEQNQIWIGTNNGLTIFDTYKNEFHTYSANNRNKLYGNVILHLFKDISGNIWLGTTDGLNKLKQSPFAYYEIQLDAAHFDNYPFITQNNNIFWYATNSNKIVRYNRKRNHFRSIEFDTKLFPTNQSTNEKTFGFNQLFFDSENQLWVVINNGIHKLNNSYNRIATSYNTGSTDFDGFRSDNIVHSIAQDNNNNIWAFSAYGVAKLDKNGGFEHEIKYDLPFAELFLNTEEAYFIKDVVLTHDNNFIIRNTTGIWKADTKALTLTQVLTFDAFVQATDLSSGNLLLDTNDNIWFSTFPHLFKLSPNLEVQRIDTLQIMGDFGDSRLVLATDSTFWIYTQNGVFNYNPNTKKTVSYTTQNGLADNRINGLLADSRNNIWLTSANGLMKIDKSKNTIENFFRGDGLTSHKFVSATNMSETTNGELIFKTTNGFVNFFPDSINTRPPDLAITRFTLFSKDYPLDTVIYKKSGIELKYYENYIGFDFSALDYTAPTQNKYRYMLEGLDKDWTEADAHNRRAPYTNVTHGDYIFRLQGANNDGVWNKTGISLQVTIVPPWWQTVFAYITYVILIIIGLWQFITWRERKLQKEKRILEDKVLERTAEIEKQKEEIEEQRDIATSQRDQIIDQKKAITDSIHYASRIQKAVLPPEKLIEAFLPEHFILNMPRDIVSGDFYWFNLKNNRLIITAADCTGHGVPGAFMSMLGVAFLNEIVNKEQKLTAGNLLDQLRKHIIKSLHQTGKENEAKDGMDMALVIIDLETMQIQLAGAYNPLVLIRNNEIIEFKADRMPIGIYFKGDKPFKNHTSDIQKDDVMYMFSDGYVDQFGGKAGRKFMLRNFKTLLLEKHKLPLVAQKELLHTKINEWMKGYEQIDDILVVGLKI